jgi:hypothetical protein
VAIGDYLTLRNTTDTTSIPANYGTLVTAVYDTTVASSGSGISYSAGTFTVSAAGKYLVGYSDQAGTTDTTNLQRNQITTWIQVEGVDAPYYGWDAGYIRKASGSQEEIMSGVAILDLAAEDTFKVVIQRVDDSTGTTSRVADRSGIYVISLDTALNYGMYRGTATAPSATDDGTVTLNLGTADEEAAPFSLGGVNPNQVNITSTPTGPVLYCYSIRAASPAAGRSEHQARVYLAGVVQKGSYSQSYSRDDWGALGMSASGLMTPADTNNIFVQLVTRDNGDITVDFDLNFQLVELPATTQAIIVEATSGDMNAASSYFNWDTNPHIDTGTFTHTVGASWINVDVAGDYLAMASLGVTSYAAVTRAVPAISFRVELVEDGSFGATSFNRGINTSGYATAATSGLLTGLSVDNDIGLVTDRVGTETGTLTVGSGGMSVLQLSSIVPNTGTAIVSYGGKTVAATGTSGSVGVGAVAYGGSVTATGTSGSVGVGVVAYGGVVTATGTSGADGVVATSYGGAVVATGKRTPVGVGVAAYGNAVTATGAVSTSGVVSLSYGGTIVATGTSDTAGTSVLSYGGAVSATGTVSQINNGTVVVAYGGVVSATGRRQGSGVSTSTITTSLVAVGTRYRPMAVVPGKLPLPARDGPLRYLVADGFRKGT